MIFSAALAAVGITPPLDLEARRAKVTADLAAIGDGDVDMPTLAAAFD